MGYMKAMGVCLLAGLIGVSGFHTSVAATPNVTVQEHSNEKLESLRKEIDKTIEDIQKLDTRLTDGTLQLEKSKKELAQLGIKIEQKNREITEKQIDNKRRINKMRSQLVSIQENQNSYQNYVVTAIIEARSLSDFFETMYAAKTITDANQELIDRVSKEEEALKDLRKGLVQDKQKVETIREQTAELQKTLLADKKVLEKKVLDLKKKQEDELAAQLQREALVNASDIQLPKEMLLSQNPEDAVRVAIMDEAKKHLGLPYVWGGTSPVSGFDCSGFTQYVYRTLGVEIPRVARDQQKVGKQIDVKDIKVGDLLFYGKPAHHVAIYAGNGYYIHAPQTGDVVKFSKMNPAKVTSVSQIVGR